jgi:hypothetical protein
MSGIGAEVAEKEARSTRRRLLEGTRAKIEEDS